MHHHAVCSLIVASIVLIFVPGCGGSKPQPAGGATGTAAATTAPSAPANDPFTAAASDAEPGERPYLEPARPFLTALAARNYGAAYDQLSTHARAKMLTGQFTPSVVTETSFGTPLENVTREQFIEWMGKSEAELGVPESIRHISVFEIDAQVLSGQGDKLSAVFAIGAMPADIPANIRKASLRGALTCQKSRTWAEAIAQDLDNVTPEQILSGQVNQETKATIEESLPYLNLKFVLVDEGGQLKIGYFEMMPPSMLD
ncbi:MAG: hypothetical protein JWN70_5252 [Planctomycetaceae bacterium]|nr:hypothetical protein [Planctomycetaceae bacterium]